MAVRAEPRYVTCVWEDAFADGVDDTTPEQAHERHKPLTMETRGWLLVDDEVGISVFYERCLEPLSYRGRTFIPRGMVKSVEDFPPKRKPRIKRPPQVTPA
jgi:hypothetical protein